MRGMYISAHPFLIVVDMKLKIQTKQKVLAIVMAFLPMASMALGDDDVTKEDADKYGYLYAHMSSAKEVTSFALSRYGIVYNDLLGSEEVFDTKAFTHTGGMRDAYVCRTESGKFMLAGTDMTSKLGWSSNHEMTFMLSNDLVHWDKWLSIDLESEENLEALGVSSGDDITAAWAPEIIYDPVTKKYVVYYSVGFKTNGHRIYYSLMNEDLTGFTKPRLYFDPGYDIIDADIAYNKLDKQYVMIYKTEYSTTNGGHKLLQATADHLVPTSGEETGTCQWVINPDFEVSETGKSIEAPSLFRPIGSRTWKLAYMNYSGGGYRMVDLDEHCLNPTNLINIKGNVKAQHGSFVTLTQREYEHLQTWANLKELLPQARSLNESHSQEFLAQVIEQANHALETSGTFDEEYQEMQTAYPALVEAMSQYREYLKESAAKGELSDLTALITNPDFSDGATGWKGTSFTQATKGVAEHYNKTFDFYQELTDMPNGCYRLTAQVFYRAGAIDVAKAAHLDGSEVITPRMYINDESCEVNCLYDTDVYAFSPKYTYPDNVTQANEAFNDKGLYACSLTAEVTDGIVRLGIKSDKMTSKDWCCFDNFKLEYLGVSDGIAFPAKEEQTTPSDIFDLQGRKVNKFPKQHGVYVMKGKKVIL